MGTNEIMKMIQEAVPALATSPVLIKLIDTAYKVFKTLYMPTLTLKNGKAEIDVESYKNENSLKQNEQMSFTLYEVTRLKNFINTVKFSEDELLKLNNFIESENEVDFDWIMRFFDAVGNISNEELQKLWGKVLAGEIQHPGNCSLRTLEIIRNMSQREVEIFNKLCKYVLESGDCYFIYPDGFLGDYGYNNEMHTFIEQIGLTYSESIIPMTECGLLSVDHELATDFKTNNTLNIYNEELICIIKASENKENNISFEPYFLTKSGVELFNVVRGTADFKFDIEYAVFSFKALKYLNPNLTVMAFKINNNEICDEIEL